MIEVVELRKGSVTRKLTIEGHILRLMEGRKRIRWTGFMNAQAARRGRDEYLQELAGEGWQVVTKAAKKTPKSKVPKLTTKDIAVAKGKKATPFVPSPKQAWPPGYAEFAERYGAGELEDLLILSPAHVKKRTKLWLELAPHAAKLFENLREHFPKADEADVVVIAASQNGDILGFPGARPSELFLFPRGSNRVIAVGATFGEALGAWCYGQEIAPRRVTGRRARFRPS